MPLRKLSFEAEVIIVVSLLLVSMFICTGIVTAKLTRIAVVHEQQMAILIKVQKNIELKMDNDEKLSKKLQDIENELKLVQASRQDMIDSLVKKQGADR